MQDETKTSRFKVQLGSTEQEIFRKGRNTTNEDLLLMLELKTPSPILQINSPLHSQSSNSASSFYPWCNFAGWDLSELRSTDVAAPAKLLYANVPWTIELCNGFKMTNAFLCFWNSCDVFGILAKTCILWLCFMFIERASALGMNLTWKCKSHYVPGG